MRNVVLKVAQCPMLHNIDFHCNFFVLKILSNTTLIKYDGTEGVLEKEIDPLAFSFILLLLFLMVFSYILFSGESRLSHHDEVACTS